MPGALPKRNLFPSYTPTNIKALDKTNIIEPFKEVGNIPIKLSQCRETGLREAKRQLQDPYSCVPSIDKENNYSTILPAKGEIGTQTQFQCSDLAEVLSLKEEIKKLKLELAAIKKELAKKTQETVVLNASLNNIFTEGQIERLKYPNIYKNWSWNDISNAICLHASGPRAYHHLYEKGYPIPHVTTLQRWARKVRFEEGILHFSIAAMKNATELLEHEKLCILMFDEMKVSSAYEYVPSSDMVRQPCNYVQVGMVRGLTGSWKQPVFYKFDCTMTKTILNNIILALFDAGFLVVAVVSDMGPKNQSLWKELGIGVDKTWLPSPTIIIESWLQQTSAECTIIQ